MLTYLQSAGCDSIVICCRRSVAETKYVLGEVDTCCSGNLVLDGVKIRTMTGSFEHFEGDIWTVAQCKVRRIRTIRTM